MRIYQILLACFFLAGCTTDPLVAVDAALGSDGGGDAAMLRDGGVDASARDGGVDASADDAAIDASAQDSGADASARDAATDAGPTGLAPGFSAPFPSRGGPILAHPSFATVTYANDANRAQVEAYGDVMTAATAWWSATTSEYGVGPLVSLGNVRLADDAPAAATQAELETYLLARANDGTLPRATDGTFDGVMYLLYVPGGSRITLSGGSESCGGWHGVHGEARSGGTRIVYALSVECGPGRGFDHMGYLQAAASHELIEVATDPYVDSMPAYGWDPRVRDPWAIFGETTDRCVGQYLQQAGDVLARSWSNVASLAGDPPCVPVPAGEVHYGVWTPMTTVRGAPGATLDVPITGFARGTIPDFRVRASASSGPATAPTLGLTMLNEGITTMLHLTLPASARTTDASWVNLTIGPTSNDSRNYPIMILYR